MFPDATGRPLHVTRGEPIDAVLGDRPATVERVAPGGNLALVPPYSRAPLLNVGFEDDMPLTAAGSSKRLKGWQATPLVDGAKGLDFGVRLVEGAPALPRTGKRHAVIGYGLSGPCAAGTVAAGARAMLTQEVRNPRAGTYTVSAHVCGGGSAADYQTFLKHFSCRLVLFGYRELTKDPTKGVREYLSVPFEPAFADKADGYRKVTLTKALRSQDGGASEIEMGVGLAIIVERRSPGELAIPAGARAFVRVDDVEIGFVPRPRNDDVTV
jgi:hypothetical protein